MGHPAEYDVLFDLAGNPYQPPIFSIVWTTLIGAGCLLFFARSRGNLRLLPTFAALAMIAFGASSIKTHHDSFLSMRSAVQSGRAIAVEGMVHEFRPDAGNGNGTESFTLADQHFVISSNVETPAFNRTVGTGGPDLTGKCVRILFLRQGSNLREIVWLGIRRSGCAGVP